MASLNSFGDGIVDRFKGMVSSSLFWMMAAYFGSKLVADETRPILGCGGKPLGSSAYSVSGPGAWGTVALHPRS